MENIVVTVDSKGIALLELDRPSALNALSTEMMAEIREALAELGRDAAVRALIITGRGRAFCAGADLMAVDAFKGGSIGAAVSETMRESFNPMMSMLYSFPRPVVCAINGMAAGGGAGIALCGDIVLAAETAVLKVVQVPNLGIVADLGANWLLPRLAGRGRAMALCLLGDTIPAATLREWGMVWECCAAEELLERAHENARRLAAVPAETVLATRRLIDEASRSGFEELLEQERLCQRQLCDSSVFADSVRKFADRG